MQSKAVSKDKPDGFACQRIGMEIVYHCADMVNIDKYVYIADPHGIVL